ncbi:hypothetical protein [Parathalassolituus penaei]|uniref:Uncharacterized protein n=1 Tax=Parathalassolituus penaei TaxID=2997323 RepID=A0A9X3EQG5_9GAMM|nr:hypothetical protein [Parathalassolituus penaei]MCY0967003.1 hypothetical protein [Parathalassolituus penaei]
MARFAHNNSPEGMQRPVARQQAPDLLVDLQFDQQNGGKLIGCQGAVSILFANPLMASGYQSWKEPPRSTITLIKGNGDNDIPAQQLAASPVASILQELCRSGLSELAN